MGGSDKQPEQPAFQGSQYKFGNNLMSSTYKNGNDIVTQWNPTGQEQQTYNTLQDKLPSLYDKATTSQDFTPYVNAYTQNQKDAVNRDYNDSMRLLKANFASDGIMGSSEGLDKLKPLQDSYNQSMQSIEANAPTYANELRNNDLAYNSSLLGNAVNGLNQFYNTGNTFNSDAQGLSQFGNNDANTKYQNAMSGYLQNKMINQQSKNSMWGNISNALTTAAGAGLMFVPGGQAAGTAILASKAKSV